MYSWKTIRVHIYKIGCRPLSATCGFVPATWVSRVDVYCGQIARTCQPPRRDPATRKVRKPSKKRGLLHFVWVEERLGPLYSFRLEQLRHHGWALSLHGHKSASVAGGGPSRTRIGVRGKEFLPQRRICVPGAPLACHGGGSASVARSQRQSRRPYPHRPPRSPVPGSRLPARFPNDTRSARLDAERESCRATRALGPSPCDPHKLQKSPK